MLCKVRPSETFLENPTSLDGRCTLKNGIYF
jgi:hypothetical protein